MSNILCMSVSKIKSSDKLEYNKQLGADNTYKLYEAMSEIVIHSAETFIQEDFDIVVFEDEVGSYQEIFHKNFSSVYDTWKTGGPNNILFLDCDTLVVAPVNVFGQFDRFQLFNYTDPKILSGNDSKNKYKLMFDHYFNAGVRYYPNTMPNELWDLGWSYAKDWDYDIWGTEQIIFNQMMYSQDQHVRTWLKPEMNFQAMNVPFHDIDNRGLQDYLREWNGIHMNSAKILHLHGTRGADNTVLLQWELWRRLTGEEFEFSGIEIIKDSNGKPSGINIK